MIEEAKHLNFRLAAITKELKLISRTAGVDVGGEMHGDGDTTVGDGLRQMVGHGRGSVGTHQGHATFQMVVDDTSSHVVVRLFLLTAGAADGGWRSQFAEVIVGIRSHGRR